MPRNDVDSAHPDFAASRRKFVKVRDFIDGEEAVKARGVAYLPMLSGHKADGVFGVDEYASYKDRAMFYGAAGRTVQALVGAIFRKDPELTWPESRRGMLEDIGRDGKSFAEIAAKTTEQVIGPGRYALLVDAPRKGDGRPYIASYDAESVTNWEEEEVGGRMMPIRVHLREEIRVPDPERMFSRKTVEQYRVLGLGVPALDVGEGAAPVDAQLTEMGLQASDLEKAVYFQQIWRKTEGREQDWTLVDQIVPKTAGGRVLGEIPITVFNPSGTGLEIENSPILALVNINEKHYRGSADLEHGRHMTAIPTPCAAGFDLKEGEDLRIGPNAWVSDNPDAKSWYLEFAGAGLGHLAEGQREKEKLMGVLGARLLEQEPKGGIEAAETVKLRQAGEQSVLAMISESVSQGLTRVLRLALGWVVTSADVSAQASINLSKDFVVGMDPKLRADLMQLWQAGGISQERLLIELKRGEALGDDMDVDEQIDATEQDDAGLASLPTFTPPVATT